MPESELRLISTWQEAEENAAKWMREWGYFDAKVTKGGSDGDIDVVASNALAQVKWRVDTTGRPAVQNLVGARMRDQQKELFFFAVTHFTPPAVEYARKMDVALFRYDMYGRMTPMSPAAKKVVDAHRIAANYLAASRWKFVGAVFLALVTGAIIGFGWDPQLGEPQSGVLLWALVFGVWSFVKLGQGLSVRSRGRGKAAPPRPAGEPKRSPKKSAGAAYSAPRDPRSAAASEPRAEGDPWAGRDGVVHSGGEVSWFDYPAPPEAVVEALVPGGRLWWTTIGGRSPSAPTGSRSTRDSSHSPRNWTPTSSGTSSSFESGGPRTAELPRRQRLSRWRTPHMTPPNVPTTHSRS